MKVPRTTQEQIVMIAFCVIVAFLTFAQSIFVLFFAPIVVYMLWDYNSKITNLDKRVVERESDTEKRSIELATTVFSRPEIYFGNSCLTLEQKIHHSSKLCENRQDGSQI